MFIAIVPALNEEKRIGIVVRGLTECGVVDEVVVVDDGSKDMTAKIAREAGAVVLSHPINRGQGAALETGNVYARSRFADFVLYFDGDNQFSPSDINPALSALSSSGADILFGSRFLDTRSNIPFFKRYILFPMARLIDRAIGGLVLSDVHNGFRLLSKTALSKIIITQEGMAHATEIPMLVKKHKLKHIEFPVKVIYHEYGQGLSGGFTILRDLILGKFV